mgnify:CR=1 FL=1
MMDALTVLVLLCLGFYAVKKKLLPRLKKGGRDALPEKEQEKKADGAAMSGQAVPDFRILSFNTGDFTHTDDMAHCVEYELGKAVSDLKKEGCTLNGDPFPIVVGCSLLILLRYCRETEKTWEVEG